MAFQFTLRGLLRLRLSLEQAELLKLQAIAAEVARARAEIESVESETDALRRRTHEALVSEGLTGAEWQFDMARETSLEALRSELLKKLATLEEKRKQQQARYRKAHMQREILSSLRERQKTQYDIEESRRAQQRTDELFLIRSISSPERGS
jgi:flagellar export protein FliJ